MLPAKSKKLIKVLSSACMVFAIVGGVQANNLPTDKIDNINVVAIPEGDFTYQAAGEFLDRGMPVNPPRVQASLEPGWLIMQRQVSQSEYMQCVQDGACKRLEKSFRKNNDPELPAVGISWNDANDYAAWLSEKTGQQWQLPTYEQWVRAAADKYQEESYLPSDENNPAVRWIAEYQREASRARGRIKPAQAFDSFGKNKLGISDMAGNVWEWTQNCFASYSVSTLPLKPRENCGIRILAGAHVAALPDFIRDPKNGACSIGLPPANLGFRLVRKA